MSDTYKECLMKYCGKEPLPHCCTVLECEIESMEPDKDGGIESTYFFQLTIQKSVRYRYMKRSGQ